MQKLFAVIGDPIAHSMSPSMHNELFEFYQIDAHYQPLHVKKADLAAAIKGLKAIGISGFNVTIPHKEAIIPFLDRVDSLAAAIGAVNTVVNENGKLVGYNTDGSGYVKGLMEKIDNDEQVLMIGAGGAARALYFTIAKLGVKRIDIYNRTKEKANRILQECPYSVQSKVIDKNEAESSLAEYDMLIQTTPIGMAPYLAESPLSLHNLQEKTVVSDIIYNPLETRFLNDARQRNAIIQNGLNMFVYQGALAFEKWTGIFPDTERMKKNVLKQLGG